MRKPLSDAQVVGAAGGVLAALVVAGLLGASRAAVNQANASLVLALVVIGASYVGGRWAGGATALAAAVSFDFFLTKPYGSLAIKSTQDIVATALLFGIGLAAGQLVDARRAATRRTRATSSELASVFDISALSREGASVEAIIEAVEREVREVLRLTWCHVDREVARPPLPELPASGRAIAPYVHTGDGFALPPEGVAIAIASRREHFGWLICFPTPGLPGISLERRRTALVLAEQLATVLALHDADAA